MDLERLKQLAGIESGETLTEAKTKNDPINVLNTLTSTIRDSGFDNSEKLVKQLMDSLKGTPMVKTAQKLGMVINKAAYSSVLAHKDAVFKIATKLEKEISTYSHKQK